MSEEDGYIDVLEHDPKKSSRSERLKETEMDILLVKIARPHPGLATVGQGGRVYRFRRCGMLWGCMIHPSDVPVFLKERTRLPGGSMINTYRKATPAEVAKWEREHL